MATIQNSPRKSVKVVSSFRDGLKVRQSIVHHVDIASVSYLLHGFFSVTPFGVPSHPTQKLSPQCIIEELIDIQSSIFLHVSTQKRYRLPSAFSHHAGKIYKALNLQRDRKIKEIV